MNEQIIDFIFKIINFFVFIGLGVYCFKKYAYQKIITGIAKKEAFLRGLFNRQQELEEQQHLLDKHIAKEEKLCHQLKKKVDLWKHRIGQERKEKQQEWEKQKKMVHERLKKQAETVAALQVEKEAYQRAINKAQVTLEQQFDQKNAQQFLAWTIAWMVQHK